MKKLSFLILFCTLLTFTTTRAQFVKNDWGALIGGDGANVGEMTIYHMQVDASGNTVLVGSFAGTVDFDPSATTVSLSSPSNTVAAGFIAKYNSASVLQWVKKIENPLGLVRIYQLTLDATGDIYVAGNPGGATDLDPNAGTFLTPTGSNWFVAKYTSVGNFVWGSAGASVANYSVTNLFINASNELGVQGCSQGSTGIFSISFLNKTTGVSTSSPNWAGTGQSADAFNSGTDYFKAKQDASGNYVMCGVFRSGNIDFDVNAGTSLLTAVGNDMFIAKYSSTMTLQWAFALNSNGGSGLIISPSNIATDATGNVYIAGTLEDTVDFDPGAGEHLLYQSNNLGPGNSERGFVAKYSPSGSLIWARTIDENYTNNSLQRSFINDFTMSGDGTKLYIAGQLWDAAKDMDITSGNLIMPSGKNLGNSVDFYQFIASIDLSGNTQNVNTYLTSEHSYLNYRPLRTFASSNGNLHVASNNVQQSNTTVNPLNFGACNNNPYPFNSPNSYLGASFAKYSPCNNPPTITSQPQDVIGCTGLPLSVSIGVGGATCKKYHWFKYKDIHQNSGERGWAVVSDSSVLYFPSFYTNNEDTGTYICTVEGECGSISSRIFTIGGPREPIYVGTGGYHYPANGGGGCTGASYTFDIADYTNNIQGDNPTYQWKKGNTVISNSTTATLNNIALADSGLYMCIVSNLCNSDTVFVDFTVTETPNPTPSPASGAFCTGSSVTIRSLSATNVNYKWMDNGYNLIQFADSLTFSNGEAGTYYLEAQTGQCSDTSNAIIITENAIPNANLTTTDADEVVCIGSSATLTASGGTSYAWSNGLGTGATKTVSPTVFTAYTVTVTNAANCTAEATLNLNVASLPTIAISPATIAVCPNTPTTLTASGADTYVWSNSLGSGDTKTVSPTGTTTYTVTATEATYGCTATATKTVTVNPAPAADISPASVAICTGSSATLTATGGAGYNWSNTLGAGATKTVSPTNTTTYTVTVTGANTCTATATKTVTVNSLPTAAIAPATVAICSGASATLTASGGTSYAWSNSLGAGASKTVSPTATTTYTVTVTDGNNCSATAAKAVTVNTVTAAINGATTICSGLSATLTASGGTAYTWSNGLGSNAQITVSPVSPTTYTVTVTGAGNCTATASQTVSVQSAPTASISGARSVCNGSNITLTANGGNTYSWSNGLGTNAAITVSPTSTTTYTVTVSLGANCSATASQTVTIRQPTTGQLAQTICAGDSYFFNGQNLTQSGSSYKDTLVNAAGCDSILTLNLTVRNPIASSFAHTICNGQSYTFNGNQLFQSGPYQETFSAANGCDSTVTLNLTILNPINNTVNAQICPGQTYVLGSQSLTQGGQYSETFTTALGCDSSVTLNLTEVTTVTGTTTAIICADETFFFNGQNLNQPGNTYKDTLTSVGGCDSIVTLTLVVNSLPIPTVTQNGNTLSAQSFSNYQWLLGGQPINGANAQTYIATQNGNYSVIVTDGNNCSDTSAVVNVNGVGINEADDLRFSIYPNPTSDILYITCIEPIAGVEVYNMLGELVHEKKGAINTIQVDLLAQGFYTISLKTITGKTALSRFTKQ